MADAEHQRPSGLGFGNFGLKKAKDATDETKKPSKPRQWKPWRDRLADHADTVLFIQAFQAPLDESSEFKRQGVMTISADGAATLYNLHQVTSNPMRLYGFQLQVTDAGAITSLTSDTAPSSAACCNLRCPSWEMPPPSVLYGGHVSGKVSAWSAKGALLLEMAGHTAAVTLIRCLSTLERLHPENDENEDTLSDTCGPEPDLATASMDASIRIWRLVLESRESSAECLFILDFGIRNPVSDLVLLSPEESIVSTWDGQVRFVSLAHRACSKAVQVAMGQVRSICRWRRKVDDEWQIFAGTDEGNISCWASGGFPGLTPNLPGSAGLLQQRLSWQGHWSHVVSLSICQDWLVSLAEDKLIRIWDPFSGKMISEFWGHGAGVVSTCTTWPLLWTGSRDHTVRSWNLGEIKRQLEETAAMELCDAQSFQYEVTFSRLTLKQLKKLAAEKKAANRGDNKGGNTRGRR